MVCWQGGTRAFFGTLLYRDAGVISAWPQQASSYVDLVHVVLGAVMVGWGVNMVLMTRAFYDSDPKTVLRIIAISLAAWGIPDTVYSVASGHWPNAVLNSVFILGGFVPPLVALWNTA